MMVLGAVPFFAMLGEGPLRLPSRGLTKMGCIPGEQSKGDQSCYLCHAKFKQLMCWCDLDFCIVHGETKEG
jgi:hypothetical protein